MLRATVIMVTYNANCPTEGLKPHPLLLSLAECVAFMSLAVVLLLATPRRHYRMISFDEVRISRKESQSHQLVLQIRIVISISWVCRLSSQSEEPLLLNNLSMTTMATQARSSCGMVRPGHLIIQR